MIPYFNLPAFRVMGQTLYPYTYLVMAGMALSYVLAQRRVRKLDLHPALSGVGLFWIAVGGFVGAHVFDVVAYHPELLISNPRILLSIWAGVSSFGGFLGGTLAFYIYSRRQGIWMLAYLDALVFGFAPGWILARGGCFASHDHPGWRTDFVLAVAFPGGARHDLGLYEMIVAAAITGVLYALSRKERFVGFFVGLTMTLYATARFALDFLRAFDKRWAGLTPAQWLSLVMLAVGVMFLVRGKRAGVFLRPRPEDNETGELKDDGQST